jgi:hypothetical protein
MESIKRNQAPALIAILLVLFSVVMVYFASQLPPYSPYYLDEHFTSLDSNVWEVGGMRNYSLSGGVLMLFDSTNAMHYFITNPKWQAPINETRLQGTVEIRFKAVEAANGSVAVASTDSWSVIAYNNTLRLYVSETPSNETSHFEAELIPGWHTLVAENGPTSFNMTLDGRLVAAADFWDGNLTRLELGTGLSSFDGIEIRGELAVSAVKADLQPLLQPQVLAPWNVETFELCISSFSWYLFGSTAHSDHMVEEMRVVCELFR